MTTSRTAPASIRPLAAPASWLHAMALGAALFGAAATMAPARAATPLADQPLFSAIDVPGNLLLALSVEFPTAISVANLGDYAAASTYLGYFDPAKCYDYDTTTTIAATPNKGYFKPAAMATNHACTGQWSGNFLNWATMQTIDPYRWALTGGYRLVDDATTTILQKAWGSNQGGNGNFPNRGTDQGNGHKLNVAPSTVTPLSWAKFNLRIWARGERMVFTATGDVNSGTPTGWTTGAAAVNTAYEVYVRVQVCSKALGVDRLESNCEAYGTAGNESYKPQGLMQKYASKIRYSAFSYLNDSNIRRDGGVMRARMKFIGPTKPVSGSLPVSNGAAREWDPDTGVFYTNPDSTDAGNSSVANSGVMNYLNKFGITSQGYKTYDNVGEMYYAALRYFKKLGNVPEYTNGVTAAMRDGFPVITDWDDPMLHSCQKNFILGIGDTNTHADGNVPGTTLTGSNDALPAAVAADTSVNATSAANKVGALEGLGTLGTRYAPGGTNNTYYIAGLAYDAHTVDMRPDADANRGLKGLQTVSTYWLDVLEYQSYVSKNFYWLAAKYGGFNVPGGYTPYSNTTALADELWYTSTDRVGSDKRPDNYFTASRADTMVAGLTKAFTSIASALTANTTSFSTAVPQFEGTTSASYSGSFDAKNWTGEVAAGTLSFDNNVPVLAEKWTLGAKLAAQLSGTGWDTGRRVVTWSGSTGVAFRAEQLSTAQGTALKPSYAPSNTLADYVNYLRGDRTYEQVDKPPFRVRTSLLGDIVGSKVRPVGPPNQPLMNAANAGYALFKRDFATRPTVVYFGGNDGMLHAVQGDLTGSNAGKELFAYVPSGLYNGPGSTPGVDGLAALGNPEFSHHYYVNATPNVYDIDFGKTPGGSGTDWRSLLIGGLGKGGKGYYAIDVTDPAAIGSATESTVASKVLWEFSHSKMGYTYGDAVVVKTRAYGWVAVLTSGYNNSDGKGYFFVVNPRTGALIGSPIPTGQGSTAQPAGMAHAVAFINDRSTGYADAVYAGDLLGNVWRLDLTTAASPFPAPVRLATLTDTALPAQPQPITTKPTVAAQSGTLRRFVLVGTGKLLDSTDIGSSQMQSFYAIVDGVESSFNTTNKMPDGVRPLPAGRSDFAVNANPVNGVTFNKTTQIGWVYDLGVTTLGWRVISDPTASAGMVTFASTLPSGNACEPSGKSRVYALDFGTGTSNLADGAFVELDGVATDVRLMRDANGVDHLVTGQDNKKDLTSPALKPSNKGRELRRLNWRELPLAD